MIGGTGRIFMSYSASDAPEARLIASALMARGYTVFFDKENLGAGQSYDGKIERAVHSSDLFIFLLSPEAVEAGCYTMSELGYAQQRWLNPDRYVLPVMVRIVDLNHVPDYLRAVTFLHERQFGRRGRLCGRPYAGAQRRLVDLPAIRFLRRICRPGGVVSSLPGPTVLGWTFFLWRGA